MTPNQPCQTCEWIKISDELPPIKEEVLMYSIDGERFVGFMSDHNLPGELRIYCHQLDGHWSLNEIAGWYRITDRLEGE